MRSSFKREFLDLAETAGKVKGDWCRLNGSNLDNVHRACHVSRLMPKAAFSELPTLSAASQAQGKPRQIPQCTKLSHLGI
jgi:hypothetical protein